MLGSKEEAELIEDFKRWCFEPNPRRDLLFTYNDPEMVAQHFVESNAINFARQGRWTDAINILTSSRVEIATETLEELLILAVRSPVFEALAADFESDSPEPSSFEKILKLQTISFENMEKIAANLFSGADKESYTVKHFVFLEYIENAAIFSADELAKLQQIARNEKGIAFVCGSERSGSEYESGTGSEYGADDEGGSYDEYRSGSGPEASGSENENDEEEEALERTNRLH